MKNRPGLTFVLTLVLGVTGSVNADFINVPIINANAETGDLSGWTFTGDVRGPANPASIQVKFDPTNGVEGDYYFEMNPTGNDDYAKISQTFDIRPYADTIEHFQFSVEVMGGTDGLCIGYDAETDREYYYPIETYVSFVMLRTNGGSGYMPTINDVAWTTKSLSSHEMGDWYSRFLPSIRNGETTGIEFNMGYRASYHTDWDWNDTSTWVWVNEIEEWRGWVGSPEYARVDSFEFQIEVVPEPCTLALLGLGGLALRRKKH